MFVDSHFHIDFPEAYTEKGLTQDQVIQNAIDAGVGMMIAVSSEFDNFPIIRGFCEKYSQVYGSVGTHPSDVPTSGVIDVMDIMEAVKSSEKFVAIGETGLDYYYDNTDEDMKEFQKYSFKNHISAALILDKPLIVHVRGDGADADVYEMLESFSERGGRAVIHCYTGSAEFARKYLELGFYVSASGISTFKSATDLHEIFGSVIPMDRLLVETDSPYLAPTPMRGKINEPAYVVHVAEFLAKLRGIELADFNKQIEANFRELFGIKK